MKLFLKRTLLFVLITMFVLFLSSLLYSHLKTKYLANKNLHLKPGTHILLLGDSHAETAFNDSIILHSQNIAFHAEHYLFTYFKLKKLLEANPTIDKVVLSFGPHNISQGADITIFSESRNSRSFARYFMLLDSEGVDDTYSPSQNWRTNYLKWKLGIPFQLKLEAKLIYKTIFSKPVSINDFPFNGEFYASSKHSFKKVNATIQAHYYKNNILLKESDLAIKYLYKIINLTKAKGVKLYLVNTPLHELYTNNIPDYFRKAYKKETNRISKNYPNVVYIDLSQIELDENNFGDYHHVNYKGSKVVSLLLLQYIIN
jgi:hypothetical protein